MASYQHISHGFDPVFDEHSRVLVLGSFPSVLSRANAFYYGNPQNRFWRVIAHSLGKPVPPNEGEPLPPNGSTASLEESIAAKKALLLEGGIALWDAIGECDIKGSSDASIKNVVPAHIERITECAHIEAVICNGATAGRLYKRYLQWKVGLVAHVLPSTSPANAAWKTERLIERWGNELRAIADELAEVDRQRETAADEGATEEPHRRAKGSTTVRTRKGGSASYGTIRIDAPAASNFAVHKSMQGNKRANTKPELLMRERLRAAGLGGYRLQWKVAGHPDIAWPGKKVCVFVNGCFWHRCPHCKLSTPKKNVEYWTAKFERNVERDRENVAALEADGWRVHVVWECELKKKTIDATMAKLLPELASELGKEIAPAASVPASTPTSEPKRYYLYVLECGDGTLYTGYTPDVGARLAQHRAGTGAKYTRGRGPLTLLASAEFPTKHDAMSAEYRFKRLTRDKKDALLAKAAASKEPFERILEEAFAK
ncbi:DNA mismatch endonuclease Vsr [Ellagibacter isourolithinifaciens]|uniref:DNA mismatch endonuclease Vsr n=1 Tax=Ellagibacter isourolithinifaciens TaxID=2137581 RepID=UPI003A8E500E